MSKDNIIVFTERTENNKSINAEWNKKTLLNKLQLAPISYYLKSKYQQDLNSILDKTFWTI